GVLGYAVGAGTATHRTWARAASLTPSTPTCPRRSRRAHPVSRRRRSREHRPTGRYARLVRAMVLGGAGEPLRPRDTPDPEPSAGQVRIRVLVCGVCRTDVHIVDGELLDPTLPL